MRSATLYRVRLPLAVASDDRFAQISIVPKGALLECVAFLAGLVRVKRNGDLFLMLEDALAQRCERVEGSRRYSGD